MKTCQIAEYIREVKDFPKEGISFKDITPILSNPDLTAEVLDLLVEYLNDKEVDATLVLKVEAFIWNVNSKCFKGPFYSCKKSR